jgi:D-psicose/D-tagatose/L-ribulose 3-epimerase
MRIGINTLVFDDYFKESDFHLLKTIAAIGYDLVEIAVSKTDFDIPMLKKILSETGLAPRITSIMDSSCFLGSQDKKERESGYARIASHIELAVKIGAKSVSGPLYINGRSPTPRDEALRSAEWKTVSALLKDLSLFAKENGIELYLEPMNRYKTDLLNTCSDGIAMINDTGASNIKILFDTYHANIEETDLAKAIETMGARYLGEVHLCDNNKGAPLSGHIDFSLLAKALQKIAYAGDVVFESFKPFGKDNIWRPLAPSQEDLAKRAYCGIKTIFTG